jgi:hypothetical protein
MRRLTISVDDDLADAFDQLVERKGYLNGPEAFRDLVRKALGVSDAGCGQGEIVCGDRSLFGSKRWTVAIACKVVVRGCMLCSDRTAARKMPELS